MVRCSSSFLLELSRHNEGSRHGPPIRRRGQGGRGRGRGGGRGRGRGGGSGRGGRTGRATGTTNANVVVPVYKTGRTTRIQNWTFFIAFMRWRDSTNYPKDHHFEEAELRAITPNCICRYIKLLEYPTTGRASSSAQYKKSISAFMLEDYP